MPVGNAVEFDVRVGNAVSVGPAVAVGAGIGVVAGVQAPMMSIRIQTISTGCLIISLSPFSDCGMKKREAAKPSKSL